jgi:hypothetical protein
MADRARALGRPDAAREVARDLLALGGVPARSSDQAANGGEESRQGGAGGARNLGSLAGVAAVSMVALRPLAVGDGDEVADV